MLPSLHRIAAGRELCMYRCPTADRSVKPKGLYHVEELIDL